MVQMENEKRKRSTRFFALCFGVVRRCQSAFRPNPSTRQRREQWNREDNRPMEGIHIPDELVSTDGGPSALGHPKLGPQTGDGDLPRIPSVYLYTWHLPVSDPTRQRPPRGWMAKNDDLPHTKRYLGLGFRFRFRFEVANTRQLSHIRIRQSGPQAATHEATQDTHQANLPSHTRS